jgi:hypothetical protein
MMVGVSSGYDASRQAIRRLARVRADLRKTVYDRPPVSPLLALRLVVSGLVIGVVVAGILSWTRIARAEPLDPCTTACDGVAAVLDGPPSLEDNQDFDETPLAAECEAQCARFTQACAGTICDLSVGAPMLYYDALYREGGAGPPSAGFDTITRTCDSLFEGENIMTLSMPRAARAEWVRKCMSGWVDSIVRYSSGVPPIARPLSPAERSAILEDGLATPDESALVVWGILPVIALVGLLATALQLARALRVRRLVRELARRGSEGAAGQDAIVSGKVTAREDSPPSFTLRDAAGRSIRATPAGEAALLPALEGDAMVHAMGRLVLAMGHPQGYRDDAPALTLEPCDWRRLCWSTTSFVGSAHRLVRASAFAVAVHGVVLGAALVALFGGFVARETAGRVVEAEPSPAVSPPPGGSPFWIVAMHAPGLQPMSAKVGAGWASRFSELPPAATVPCIAVDDRLDQLGARPAVDLWRLVVGFALAVGLAVLAGRRRLFPAGKRAAEVAAVFTRR